MVEGEMPRAGAERALSERWIDELIVLKGGGPTTRVPVRTRLVTVQEDRPWFVYLGSRLGGMMWVGDWLLRRWTKPVRTPVRAEVALYEPGVRAGGLPTVVVDFPVPTAARIDAQGGGVDLRGELGPGHAVVLVLDDGEVVACQYPAEPPPPLGAAHRWAWR